jgi:uncharacterized protein
MPKFLRLVCLFALLPAISYVSVRAAAAQASSGSGYGIASKKPVFGGACKACPWGILAMVTRDSLAYYGYDTKVCWVCWSTFGPREMADRTKPVMPDVGNSNPLDIEPPPDAVLDIAATSEINLDDAWDGVGAYAADNKKRQNYRVIAAVQQPNWLIAAAAQKSGITSLSQVANRTQPTWVVADNNAVTRVVLDFYGITEEKLKVHGGGFLRGTLTREKRATGDVFLGGGLLVNTPEQRMWYEVSQLNDLNYLDFDEALLARLAKTRGYSRANLPYAAFRGLQRTIPTVMRSVHLIYVRDDAPDDFAYTVAKALDEHQELFRLQAEPWFYDPRLVAKTDLIPLHPGALRYYRERGYIR